MNEKFIGSSWLGDFLPITEKLKFFKYSDYCRFYEYLNVCLTNEENFVLISPPSRVATNK